MEALKLDIVLNSTEAETALIKYETALIKAGHSAEEAAAKVEKFEKSFSNSRARKDAKKELDDIADSSGNAGKKTDALTSAVLRYAAPAAIGMAIVKTVEWADRLSDLASKHRMTTDDAQKLGIVAQRNGSTFERYAGLMETASNKIAKGNEQTSDALAELGLSVDELRKMDPYSTTKALADGLNEIDDPARRAALRMTLFGEAGGDTLQMLGELTDGIEDVTSIVDKDMVEAGDKASSMWGRFKDTVMAVTNEAILQSINPFVQMISYVDDLTTSLDAAAYSAERLAPLLPGRPGAFGGAGALPVPGDPMSGAGGQSWSFLNKFTGQRGKAATAGSAVTPYTANQWAGMNAVYGNMMGGGIPGFPGWAFPDVLSSSMSAQNLGIGFAHGNQMVPFAGTVGMNAPGGGGSWLSNLFKGGSKGGAAAGIGIGALTSLFGSKLGLSGTGQSIGAMAGSFFGPLGSALGGLGGGLLGKLFGGGNKDGKEINAMKGGEEFGAIKAKAEELGISMDKVFSAKKVEDFNKALKDVSKQIAEQEAESNRVHDAMKRWGLTIEDMGPKFKQTEMDKAAKGFTQDFYDLVNAGADVNKVIEKMGPEIGKFVHSSIEMGTQVPLEMKKIIEKMIEQGTLLDKNGEKFTDIGQIPFAENLNAQFTSLITKLDALLSKVFGLADAFDAAAGAAGNFNSEAGNTPDVGGGPETNVSTGGVVFGRGKVLHFQKGGFVPRGTDSVPAMLTPGEMVLARDQVKAMARGGRSGSVTVNLNIAGYLDSPQVQRNIARVVTDAIDRDVRMRRVS